MPKINNIEFLTLPQQVSKNKKDITALQEADVVFNDKFDDVNQKFQLQDSTNDSMQNWINFLIDENYDMTADTGWVNLSLASGIYGFENKSKIRRLGKSVTILISLYRYSDTDLGPGPVIMQISSIYAPSLLGQITLATIPVQGGVAASIGKVYLQLIKENTTNIINVYCRSESGASNQTGAYNAVITFNKG